MPLQILVRACVVGLVTMGAAFFILFPDNSTPDKVAHFLSDHVNDGFQILAHLLVFAIAWRWRSWRPVLLDLSVAGVVTAVVQLSKRFFIAPIAIRPSGGYEGFPSGHASATFSLAFVLSLYYPKLWWAWYGTAALVTWSRIQTNAHTELQIAAGMVFGTLVAWGVSQMLWQAKKQPKLWFRK